MITREEIKKVEKLQKIENKIKQLKEDYKNIKYSSLCYYKGFDYYFLNGDYEKEMLSIIKHKILLFERKRKELFEGKQSTYSQMSKHSKINHFANISKMLRIKN